MNDPTLFTDPATAEVVAFAEAAAGERVPLRAVEPESLAPDPATAEAVAGGSPTGRDADRSGGLVALFASHIVARDLSDGELEDRLRLVGRCEARLAAVKAETVGELARRRGEARTADLLRDGLKQSRGRSRRDLKLAGQFDRVPETARALKGGPSPRGRPS